MVSPDSRGTACPLSGRNSTYRPVQILEAGSVDLKRKLADWEKFYNFSRPHGAFNGRTPYEALREKL